MKEKILKERGITLIALVITIIVLLILAGVTISIMLHTGIIDNSQKAVDLYEANAKNETETMDYLQDKFGLYISYLDNINGTENKKMIEDESVGYKYYNPVVPAGFKAVNTEDASWKVVEDKELGKVVQGWNSGLVIEDKNGNQFVWVPCYIKGKENDQLVEYTKTLGEKNQDGITKENFEEVVKDDPKKLPEGVNSEESQIGTYGGFYIARYEAGIPESLEDAINGTGESDWAKRSARNIKGTPVSKKNQVPWNSINYEHSKENAESMYTGDKVKSGLVTGTMWDTTLQWLLITHAINDFELNQDSTSWGNYITSTISGVTSYSEYIGQLTGTEWKNVNVTKPKNEEGLAQNEYQWLLKTGNTEYTKRNNIYDLAGNLMTWITEKYNDEYKMACGGSCNYEGSYVPANYRGYTLIKTENAFSGDIGFRVALYIL